MRGEGSEPYPQGDRRTLHAEATAISPAMEEGGGENVVIVDEKTTQKSQPLAPGSVVTYPS